MPSLQHRAQTHKRSLSQQALADLDLRCNRDLLRGASALQPLLQLTRLRRPDVRWCSAGVAQQLAALGVPVASLEV